MSLPGGQPPGRRADALFELVSDFYWEQDADGRFIRLEGAMVDTTPIASWLGKRPAEVGFATETGQGWPRCAPGATPQGWRFRDQIVVYTLEDGTRCHLSLCGQALYDAAGALSGYRGFGKDVTFEKEQQRELVQFRAAMDACPAMVFIVDRASMRFVYVNETACRQTGLEQAALLREWPHELLFTDRETLERDYDEVIRRSGQLMQTSSRARDGGRTVVEVHRRALHQGGRWLIVSVVHDISARQRAEQSRARLERMYATLSATNEAILRATTPNELYQKVCDAAVDGGGFALATLVLADAAEGVLSVAASSGMSVETVNAFVLSAEPQSTGDEGLVAECIRRGEPCLSNDYLADSRTRRWHALARRGGICSAAAVPLIEQGRAVGALLLAARRRRTFDQTSVGLLQRMAENIVFAQAHFEHEAERERSERYIEYMATHDELTGLPNRSLFNQLLELAIADADQVQRRFAVMFLDLDRFKVINDSLGHDAGDALLKIVARRLRASVRATDVVARIGGDEFLVMIEQTEDHATAGAVADNILATIVDPVTIKGHDYRVTASLGIALYPDDGREAKHLLKNADMAMYQAKEKGKNTFEHYSPAIRARTLERITLESRLRRAVERDEFALVYQARISLASSRITGVEALLRWNSPELGALLPDQFLPVAEETGLIIRIGSWVLETACVQSLAWQASGLRPVPVAVNISPVQFADAQLVSRVEDVLARTGLAPNLLELDISESAVMRDVGRSFDVLRAIKRLGVQVAIDNFGAGYSSLTRLRELPIDSLKIDRSLIRDVSSNAGDQIMARAIIDLARNLSLNVVAEGVETAEQQRYLRSEACDDVQGYYFSRPDAPDAFAALLGSDRSNQPG
ncbi:sensor domain-containing protein [Salinisphaera aquimarina]|uniref:EAL domain-containing protein n=1 Tax=Salinisphaera aquimarina TaxID=2094031 RepID=A0ABV7EP18_9GAMM